MNLINKKSSKVISLALILSLLMSSAFFFNVMQTFAQTKTKVIIHYKSDPKSDLKWNMWIWPEGGDGKAYPFTGEDAFGKIAEIELDGDLKKVGAIVRTDDWMKDGTMDRFVTIDNGLGEVWIKTGDEKTYTSPPDGEYRVFKNYAQMNLTIHYYRYDHSYDGWNLQVWAEGKAKQDVQFNGEDSFGKVAKITLPQANAGKAGLNLIKSDSGKVKVDQEFGDRMITTFKEDGSAEIWLGQGQNKVFYKPEEVEKQPSILSATLESLNEIIVETNFPFKLSEGKNAGIEIPGVNITSVKPANAEEKSAETNRVMIKTQENLDIGKEYVVTKALFKETKVTLGGLMRTEAFDDLFYYDGNDLGNTYTKAETKFRLWAPTASAAKLVVYDKWDAPQGVETDMTKSEKGTWTSELSGDKKGDLYTYKVKIGEIWNEAVDPYAHAVSVNGDKGAVEDLTETNPKGWSGDKKPAFKNHQDAIIYELHIRDLSISPDSGIEAGHKGKFLGLTQKGTKGPGGMSSGLDYIKDLGVTHVQLLPMFDYNSVDETKLDQPQFNWGYDPKNFNAPEGSYSTNPYEPNVRIQEMKQMIQALHDDNLRVIMDVVYNHMFSANSSNLGKLVPGYYYRYTKDGKLSNGSGVGNDTASERKMMRKFIVDSVKYWTKEYHLDGFRFDLMGIHDIETMKQIREELNKIDPSIIIIGEGWDLGTNLPAELKANQKNAVSLPGIGQFNDVIRDGLKGSVFNKLDKGFINGKLWQEESIQSGIAGAINFLGRISSYAKEPEQAVNYIEAHDNNTLWDKLILTNPQASDADRVKMTRLASSILLTSQGITFLHAGQEFLRTKGGNDNSYKSPDAVNQLDWKRRELNDKEVQYTKGLITLRKSHAAFRMGTADEIRKSLVFLDAPKNVVAFTLNNHANGDTSQQLIVAHNANLTEVEVKLPVNGTWDVLVNGEQAGNKAITTLKGETIKIPALSSLVLSTQDAKQGSSKSMYMIYLSLIVVALVVSQVLRTKRKRR